MFHGGKVFLRCSSFLLIHFLGFDAGEVQAELFSFYKMLHVLNFKLWINGMFFSAAGFLRVKNKFMNNFWEAVFSEEGFCFYRG